MRLLKAIAWYIAFGIFVACIAAPFGWRALEATGVAWIICLPALLLGGLGRVADRADVSIISMKSGWNYAIAGMPIRLAWVLGIAAGLYSRFGERWGPVFWLVLIAFYESTLLLIVKLVAPLTGTQRARPPRGTAPAEPGLRGGDRHDVPG